MEFVIILLIIGWVATIILYGGRKYRNELKEEKKFDNVVEISLEDVTKFVKEHLDDEDEKPLDELFIKWINEEPKPNLMETSSEYVLTDLGECRGYECSCSEQREDCCRSVDSKRCVIQVNVNKLCGIEEYVNYRHPKGCQLRVLAS